MTTDAFEFIMCGCIVYECLLIRGLLCSCTEEQFYTDHPTVIVKLLFCFFPNTSVNLHKLNNQIQSYTFKMYFVSEGH